TFEPGCRPMIRSAKVRALITCYALALCFTGFSARLIYVQVKEHDLWSARAAAKHCDKQIIYARRGLILDVNGQTLADNDPVRTVVADATLLADQRDDAAGVLAGPLGLDESELREKLASG